MNILRKAVYALIIFPAFLLGSLSFAHHGTFTFDGDTVITLEGEVIAFHWTNPHSALEMAVVGADGMRRQYYVEADGPSILGPLGVSQDSLRPGDKVIAYVSPSQREGGSAVLGRELIKEDGTVIGLSVAYTRRRERQNQVQADSILGTWVPDQRALFEFVQNRNDWQLTEAGAASLEAYDLLAPFSQTECIPATSPTLLMYPTAKVFVDQGDYIELLADWMGAVRTIYMNGGSAVDKTLQGHSVGSWDGDSLVVETTHFEDNAIGNTFGIASSANKSLVERFSLEESGLALRYSFELSDPYYLEGTEKGSFIWHYRPDVEVSSEACSPEVASRHLEE